MTKSKTCNKALMDSAEKNIQKRIKINRETEHSEEIRSMFKERQDFRDDGDFEHAKKMTGGIRRNIKSRKLEHNLKHLEEELWYDIKKSKG